MIRSRRYIDSPISVGSTRQRGTTLLTIATAGVAVGFLTGLFGVGGGFVIVPALTVAVGLAMRRRSPRRC